MHGMMRTRSVVSAPRACRGGGYRRFRRNARAPWVNCWRRPSPLGAGPRCPWIGSRHGMTWQRPTACSRMGAAVRLLLSPFFATSCARGGARAASRFGSVAEICRRALAATLALTAGALPARAPRPCKPCGRMRRLAGSSPMAWHWRLRGPQRLPTCSWPPVPGGIGWPTVSGCMVSRRACSCSTRRRTCRNSYASLSGQQPALVDLRVLPGQVLLSGKVGDAQWVARMEAGGAAYRRQHFQVRLGAPAAFVPPAWLPADASLKLDFEIQEDGRRVREQIWRSALSPRRAQVCAASPARRGLARRACSGRRGAALGTDGAALQWTATPVEQGSGIWIRSWTR